MKKFLAGIAAGIVLGIILCVAEAQHRWTDFYVLHNHKGYMIINYDYVVYNDGCRVKKNWHLRNLKSMGGFGVVTLYKQRTASQQIEKYLCRFESCSIHKK